MLMRVCARACVWRGCGRGWGAEKNSAPSRFKVSTNPPARPPTPCRPLPSPTRTISRDFKVSAEDVRITRLGGPDGHTPWPWGPGSGDGKLQSRGAAAAGGGGGAASGGTWGGVGSGAAAGGGTDFAARKQELAAQPSLLTVSALFWCCGVGWGGVVGL